MATKPRQGDQSVTGALTVISIITLLSVAVRKRHDQRHPEVLIAQARQTLQTTVLPGSNWARGSAAHAVTAGRER
jgi:hypothetical protein